MGWQFFAQRSCLFQKKRIYSQHARRSFSFFCKKIHLINRSHCEQCLHVHRHILVHRDSAYYAYFASQDNESVERVAECVSRAPHRRYLLMSTRNTSWLKRLFFLGLLSTIGFGVLGVRTLGGLKPTLRWLERRYFAHLGDSGALRFVERGRWEEWHKGLWVRTSRLKRERHWSHVTLRITRFDPSKYTIKLWHGKRRSIHWIMRHTKAIAAINGGVFDPKNRPLGLWIQDGKRRNTRLNKRRIDGVFYETPKHIGITFGRLFKHKKSRWAFQSAPMLVARGHRLSLKRSWVVDRRSACCIDKKGNVLLMTTDGFFNGLSFHELGLLMRLSAHEGGLSCQCTV